MRLAQTGLAPGDDVWQDSKVGLIPAAWECVHLGDVFTQSRERGEAGLAILSVTMDRGLVARDATDRRFGQALPPESSLRVRIGDIAYNMMRMWQGAVAYCDREGVVSPAYVVCRPKAKRADARFMYYVFKSYNGLHRLLSFSHGITSDRLRLYFADFSNIPVQLPPYGEQQKIADILTTLDTAIRTQDALITAKELRKRGLARLLLTGKKRLPGFADEWKRVTLRDALEYTPRVTKKPTGVFLSAGVRSHGRGVFLKKDFAAAGIALDELFELKTGDLVLNITFAWEGAVAIVPREADGALVSHRFPTFRFREDKAVSSFFRHYILTQRFVFDCGLASPGGAGRNRVLSKSGFLNIGLSVPSAEEQARIGEILDTAAEEIRLLRQQRAAIDLEKRALMQRLLTGKLRVNT